MITIKHCILIIISAGFTISCMKKDVKYEGPIGMTSEKYLAMNEPWFQKGYRRYDPSEQVISKLSNEISKYDVLVFGGTWCPDTHEQVPKFFKVMNEAGAGIDSIYLVPPPNADTTRTKGLDFTYDVRFIPTFLFLKEGKVQHKLSEYIKKPMEERILELLNSEPIN